MNPANTNHEIMKLIMAIVMSYVALTIPFALTKKVNFVAIYNNEGKKPKRPNAPKQTTNISNNSKKEEKTTFNLKDMLANSSVQNLFNNQKTQEALNNMNKEIQESSEIFNDSKKSDYLFDNSKGEKSNSLSKIGDTPKKPGPAEEKMIFEDNKKSHQKNAFQMETSPQ